MRVSTEYDDPAFDYLALVLPVTFTLNGEVMDLVLTADDKTGELVRHLRDKSGQVMLNDRNVPVRHTEKGKVEIKIQCPEHKSYRAIRRPRCECERCWIMWEFLSSK